MRFQQKTIFEIHRDLIASGVFKRYTQKHISTLIGVDQATVSRISAGQFKRVNKSVRAICKYAKISTFTSPPDSSLDLLTSSKHDLPDPEKRKLVTIIGLALDLLKNS